MTGTILITRPREDGEALAEALQERNFRVIHEPMLEIFLRHTERQALDQALASDPDAVIVTSGNGVRALAALTEWRDLSLVCLGEATANTAQSLGFSRIATGGGDAEKLVAHIRSAYDAGSRFLYISGAQVRIDISAALAAHGMITERLALYEASAVTQISDTLTELLKRGQIDGVTFFSPRTASIFVTLLTNAGLQETAESLHAFALSETIVEALATLPWKSAHAARDATLASLVRSVDNALG